MRNTDLHQIAATLPRPRRRAEEMLNALLDGRSVIWTFPKTMEPSSVIRWLMDQCAEDGYTLREIRIPSADADPETVLANAILGVNGAADAAGGSDHSLLRLLFCRAPDVIVLCGIETLSPVAARSWARFLSRWSTQVRRRSTDDFISKAFLVPTSDLTFAEAVQEEPFVLQRTYWGWIGDIEMRVLARELAHLRSVRGTERLWLETSLVGVAGSDVDVLQWLTDRMATSDSAAGIIANLAEYGRSRGWDKLLEKEPELLQQAVIGSGLWSNPDDRYTQDPPVAGRRLWLEGLLDKDRYEGICLHSAAAALRGDTHLVEHRIWRGQARTLLPVLDAVRLEVCEYLSDRHAAWRTYEFSPTRPADDEASLPRAGKAAWNGAAKLDEYPAIVAFVDGLRKKYGKYRPLYNAVKKLRDSRNQLAHYNPLNRSQFDRFWEAARTARDFVRDN